MSPESFVTMMGKYIRNYVGRYNVVLLLPFGEKVGMRGFISDLNSILIVVSLQTMNSPSPQRGEGA